MPSAVVGGSKVLTVCARITMETTSFTAIRDEFCTKVTGQGELERLCFQSVSDKKAALRPRAREDREEVTNILRRARRDGKLSAILIKNDRERNSGPH